MTTYNAQKRATGRTTFGRNTGMGHGELEHVTLIRGYEIPLTPYTKHIVSTAQH